MHVDLEVLLLMDDEHDHYLIPHLHALFTITTEVWKQGIWQMDGCNERARYTLKMTMRSGMFSCQLKFSFGIVCTIYWAKVRVI
jgi:hypothetical protein